MCIKTVGESNDALQQKLSRETLESWNKATQQVCAAAYAPSRQEASIPRWLLAAMTSPIAPF